MYANGEAAAGCAYFCACNLENASPDGSQCAPEMPLAVCMDEKVLSENVYRGKKLCRVSENHKGESISPAFGVGINCQKREKSSINKNSPRLVY